ncbi:UDP-N-acetylmuramoylalanyl-D-glutamyl-2 6-diaminopimelate--D-alanyl-D-alanine ligase [Paramagnetospirillum magnetotacticum MS-1]|uniref:UDP-N-acetylmuramoyl-tripeptide--D-alanyl-D-alanine ligase n=1 Tax=Paramagnetospirillum magnetotacticum MS-1 TaxID=272627 RepID=A0A0C2UVE1_PARME|nr:UDP-N-acetylmuramoylalanyl-D-glutamyl-2,6-diaminopimelate--D-alanyl-D-alanine ligase [Paramagnetospirillum magnetotacticum]KIL96796.1 UDP-N-acetylmuramoylalanyl-D-glutamyl-2 6-diaminopimelate--D-alanyl-D-alanine ligase [Paramagnetospirillum magnetotacticum MS-1]
MNRPLWTSAEAAAAVAGTPSGPAWEARGVSIDSRTVQPSDLFIALEGPNHDGHDHVASALAGGAAGALVHKLPKGVQDDAPLILVRDTMTALQDLGVASRARSSAHIVAVTGSVGKTGSKEMLALALSDQGVTHYSLGSFNNHWGVPLSLARMPAGSRYAIFEIGMNHPGEITPLVRMVRPHVAVITTVEMVHMEFFASTAEIAAAKAEIFDGIEPGGMAVLPRDNAHFAFLAEAAAKAGITHIRSFGNHIESTARLLDCAVDPQSTAVFALLTDQPLSYRIGVAGRQWATNSLAVLLAVEALGADVNLAAMALAAMSAPKGRGQRRRVEMDGGSFDLIDESYNASPVSMKAAIAALASVKPAKGGRRIAVLGDMLELGPQGPMLHASMAETVERWNIDLVFTAGILTAHLHDALAEQRRGGHAADSDAVSALVKAAVRPGDVVMVKGSAGSRMGRVVNALAEGGRSNAL